MQLQNNQPDCLTQIFAWWANVPFGTKSLMVVTLSIFMFDSIFNGVMFQYFADYPILVLKGQVWRLFFTQFVNTSVLGVLFGLLSVYFSAIVLEKTIGSAVFLIDMMVKCFLVQVLLVIISIPFIFYWQALQRFPSFGLWNLLLVYISLRCFSNPDQDSQFLCFPITIRNIYYPFAIILFMCLMQPDLSPIAAVLYGYLEYRFFNGMIFRPQEATALRIENGFLFRRFLNRTDFVKVQTQFTTQTVQTPVQQSYQGKGIQIGSDFGKETMPPQLVMQQLQKEQGENQENQDDIELQDTVQFQKKREEKKKNYNPLGEDSV